MKLKVKPGPPPLPDNPAAPPGDAVLITGSKTVLFNGSNACRLGDIAMSCSDPVRLPSSVLLAIPKGMPVLIGGPPALDWSAAASAFFLRNKWTAGLLHQLIDRLKPGRLRNLLHWAACELTGHPVDVASGRMMTFPVDFELPGPIPLEFRRVYASSWADRATEIGFGWSHTLDESVRLERGKVVYQTGDGRELEFDTFGYPGRRMAAGQENWDPTARLTLTCHGEGAWSVTGPDGLTRDFDVLPGNRYVSRLKEIRNHAGDRISLEYDAQGRLEWVTDSAGRRIRFVHDARGRLHRVALPGPTWDGWFDAATYSYSDAGDLVDVRDALGASTTYEYVNHLMVRETDRDGLSFYFIYDGDAATASCVRTWGDGGIFDHELVYDKKNGRTFVTDSLGHTTTYVMNAAGAVVEIFDPHGASSKTEYNDVLWKTADVDALGGAFRYEHDARGNVTKTTLPNGVTTELRFGSRDLPIWGLDAAGATWEWLYDDALRLVERRSSAGERMRVA
ncbi:MAG: hypothetical protein EOP08_01215, partial [Proteobacteria bacterium]